MIDPAFARNRILGEQLREMVDAGNSAFSAGAALDVEFEVEASPDASRNPRAVVDVVISANEINDKHGTGPLVKRIFHGRKNIFSIRSKNDWGGQNFGDWNVCIPQGDRERPEYFGRVLAALGNRRVRQALCVPFLADEVKTAIAVKEIYGAELCSYLMDDQNVAAHNIPDDLMTEFFRRCSLRLVTHAELRDAYERKFGMEFFVLPAVVPDHLVAREPVEFSPPEEETGVLIGSFWDQSWFDRTCDVLEGLDCRIDWFGNNKSPWLRFPPEDLERAGITARGLVPEPELAQRLRDYSYVIVPVGTFDDKEDNTGVARLSLPGRILFAVSTSHTPLLLLGSEETCGARFVRHFDLGEVAPYSSSAVGAAIRRLLDPAAQRRMRQNALAVGPKFSDRGVVEWLEKSIEAGRPADERFEEIFTGYDSAPVLAALGLDQAAAPGG